MNEPHESAAVFALKTRFIQGIGCGGFVSGSGSMIFAKRRFPFRIGAAGYGAGVTLHILLIHEAGRTVVKRLGQNLWKTMVL